MKKSIFGSPILALVALLVFASGCEDAQAGADASGAGCPAGTKAVFDSGTGKLTSCVPDDDGGNVAQGDSTTTADGSKTTLPDGGVADTKASDDTTASGDGAPLADMLRTLTCKPGATGNDKWFQCEPIPGKGKLHGESCTQDADCLYGSCMFGLPVANYDKAIGVCNKNCGYVGGGSKFIACGSEDDNPKSAVYKCVIEKTQEIGNTKQDKSLPNVYKMCVRNCLSDADCLAWNPALPNCHNGNSSTQELSTPPSKLCIKLPPK